MANPDVRIQSHALPLRAMLLTALSPALSTIIAASILAILGGIMMVAACFFAGLSIDLSLGQRHQNQVFFVLSFSSILSAFSVIYYAERFAMGRINRLGHAIWKRLLSKLHELRSEIFLLNDPLRFSRTLSAARTLVDDDLVRAGLMVPTLIGMLATIFFVRPSLGCSIGLFVCLDVVTLCICGRLRGAAFLQPGDQPPLAIGLAGTIFKLPEGWEVGGGDTVVFNRLAGEEARSFNKWAPVSDALARLDLMRLTGRLIFLSLTIAGTGGQLGNQRIGMGEAVISISAISLVVYVSWTFGSFLRLAELQQNLVRLSDFANTAQSQRQLNRSIFFQKAKSELGIRFHELAWRPSVNEKFILSGVSGQVEPGGNLGVCGQSGSGISTFCRLISGLLQPDSGTVVIGDGTSDATLAGTIILIDLQSKILPMSVRENLCLGRRVKETELWHMLDIVGLSATIRDRGGLDLKLEPSQLLSGGERARLIIARGLIRMPAILVIDFLLDAVESAQAHRIIDAIRGLGITLILASGRTVTLSKMDSLVRLTSVANLADQ